LETKKSLIAGPGKVGSNKTREKNTQTYKETKIGLRLKKLKEKQQKECLKRSC